MRGASAVVTFIFAVSFILDLLGRSYVQQNLVFTHDGLTTTKVPFYSSSLGEGTTSWHGYHWWEYASDGLRMVPSYLTLIALVFGVAFKMEWVGIYIGITSILFVTELLKLLKRCVDYVRCGAMQFCRNFDVAENETVGDANSVFVMSVFLTLAFVILFAIDLGLFQLIESSLKAFHNKNRTRKEEKNIEKQELELDATDVKELLKRRISQEYEIKKHTPKRSHSKSRSDNDSEKGREKEKTRSRSSSRGRKN
jgi:hypothetical protein